MYRADDFCGRQNLDFSCRHNLDFLRRFYRQNRVGVDRPFRKNVVSCRQISKKKNVITSKTGLLAAYDIQ